jgi:hypothetical protein
MIHYKRNLIGLILNLLIWQNIARADVPAICNKFEAQWAGALRSQNNATIAAAKQRVAGVKAVCPMLAARTAAWRLKPQVDVKPGPPPVASLLSRRPPPLVVPANPKQNPRAPFQKEIASKVLPKRPFFTLDASTSQNFNFRQPDWFQVLARYPELEALTGQGGNDLSAWCLANSSGFLDDCWIAGRQSNRSVRAGAKLMMSMIQVLRKDGTSVHGKSFCIPVSFGLIGPAPEGGYCSNPEMDFGP